MSKGSKPRPIANKEEFLENWDKIFKKKKLKKSKKSVEQSKKNSYNPFSFLKY